MSKMGIKCEPIKILDITVIQKEQMRKSIYELRLSALKNVLEPVKNKEVAVIGIIGAARRGKSFILNYMHRYLINPNNPQWMGKDNEPLEGFEWRCSVDPQTFGIWFSLPIVLKQSNGKDIAVILMDTQGLFDDTYQPRDWSTIAGISLLTSSCLIFNLINNISEDKLTFFDTYINYGLKASEDNTDSCGKNHQYQGLLFLVRDWNVPNEFRFGSDGGKQYLEKKLMITETQSPQAQNVRKNIKKCFENVSCFLMPPFGDVLEIVDFNGSVKQLKDRFKDFLKEFVESILNPEELIPNTIEGTAITGEELLQKIQVIVEVFNRKELPDSQQILEANAKLSGKIFIRKLKDLHLNYMRSFIQTKAFITQKNLINQNELYRKEIIEEFDSSNKSSDTILSDRLLDSIKNNFDEILNENENRRQAFIEKSIEKCGIMFTNLVNEDLKDNRFVETDVLESKFRTYEKDVYNEFEASFFGEEKSMFCKDRLELNEFILNCERGARITNHERIKEFEKTKESYVKNVTDYYELKMIELLNNSVYLSKENFKDSEKLIRTETKDKFETKYNFEDPIKNEIFDLKVNQKLKESRINFIEKNIEKCRVASECSANIVQNSVLFYKQELNGIIHLIKTIDDFESSHKIVHKKAVDVLLTCPYKDSAFFDVYFNSFNEEIKKLYSNFISNLIEENETQKRVYETKSNEAFLIYENEMKKSLEKQKFTSTEMLKRFSKNKKREAVKHFENNFTETNKQDQLYLKYLTQLKDNISEVSDNLIEVFEENQRSDERKAEILCEQFKQNFNKNINTVIERATNFNELSNLIFKFKNTSKSKIFEDNSISDKILVKNKIDELDNFLDRRFHEIKAQFDNKRDNTLKEYQNKLNQANIFYKYEINAYLDKNEYITDDQLRQLHENLTKQIISDLNSNLKPAFDFEIKQNIDKCVQSIDNEYQNYIKIIENNRDKKFNRIKENCSKFTVEYETEIKSYLNVVKSVEELQDKHKSILESILKNSRETIENSDNNLILLQTKYLENEISKKFNMAVEQYKERIVKIEEKYQSLQELSENFYLKEIDSHFNSKQTYGNVVLDNLLSKLRMKTLNNFNEELKKNNLYFDQFKMICSKNLNDIFEANNLKYKGKNQENWKLSLDDYVNRTEKQYKMLMESHLSSAQSERDLRSKHIGTMDNLFKDFIDKFSYFESDLVLIKRIELRDFMDKEMLSMTCRLHDNIDSIRKNCHETFVNILTKFNEEINQIIEKDEINCDQEFSKFHEQHLKEATKSFKTHLNENNFHQDDAERYLENFKQSIDDKSKYHFEMFKTKIQNKLKNLIKEYEDIYDKEMAGKVLNFNNLKDLKDFHFKTIGRLIDSFGRSFNFEDQKKLEPYLKELQDKLNKSYKDNDHLLRIELDRISQNDRLFRTEVRRHYNEKMATFLKNSLFIEKDQLKTNHETVLENIFEKFKSGKENMTEIELRDFINKTVSDLYSKIYFDNEMRRPTHSIAVGIDLGTTNSCVAVFDSKLRSQDNIVVIPNELGYKTTPSVVSFRDKKVIIVGDVAKDDIHAYPKNTISSVKRLIGQNFSKISVENDLWSYRVVKGKDDLPKISVKVDGKEEKYFAEQISAEVLKKLKKSAENHLNCEISKAVITVPAYFTDAQKEATKQAGKLANLDVLRIINEPTAAAIAFKVDRNNEEETRKVLIYDFGGGTFDVSLLDIDKGVINVLGVDGNNHLGGDDFDKALIEHCLKRFTNQYQITLTGTDKENALCRLRSECEKHKKRLSAVELTVINIDNFHENKDLSIEITRSEFEELIDHLIVDSIKLVENVLKTAKIKPEDINDIVLVGGSTRIPKVQQSLSELFKGRPLNHSVNPDEAVAKGAAMQAAILNGQLESGFNIKLNDVTPLSLGVEVKGREFDEVIPRNTRIPAKINKLYFTIEDKQTSVEINIYEGENKIAKDNHLLGQFTLRGIPAAPARKEPIDVTFAINEEGILNVKAKVVSTGSEEGIQITEHKARLTPERIEKILKKNSKQ